MSEQQNLARLAFRRKCEAAAEPIIRKAEAGELTEQDAELARASVTRGVCPFCGAGPYKSPANHVYNMHGITRRRMSDLIGFTYTESICSTDLRERLSALHDGDNPQAKVKPNLRQPRRISSRGASIRQGNLRSIGEFFQTHPGAASDAGRKGGSMRAGRRYSSVEHGTRSEYRKGCRCNACKEAHTQYWREWRLKNPPAATC